MDVLRAALSAEELVSWQKLVTEEEGLPQTKKGERPSKETLEKIRDFRARKKAFLETLPAEKRAAVEGRKQEKKDGGGSSELAKKEQHLTRIEALKKFCIRDENGESCELVDIGINIQSRFKRQEIQDQLERAFAAGTTRVILTGCSLKSSSDGLALCEAWYSSNTSTDGKFPVGGFHNVVPLRVYATVGVHPHDAKTVGDENGVFQDKFKTLRELASSPYCVSLGECGLDYDRMFSPMQVQKKVFEAQVALAAELGRPLFVHLRERDADKGEALGAVAHAEEILGRYQDKIDPSKVCVHCFTGDANDLIALTSKGYCIGLTGFIGMKTRASGTGTLEAIANQANLSLDRLMIETDSPFMSPNKSYFPPDTGLKKAKNNEPSAMPAVCRAVAEAFHGGVHPEYVIARKTTENAIRFFDLVQADERISSNLHK